MRCRSMVIASPRHQRGSAPSKPRCPGERRVLSPQAAGRAQRRLLAHERVDARAASRPRRENTTPSPGRRAASPRTGTPPAQTQARSSRSCSSSPASRAGTETSPAATPCLPALVLLRQGVLFFNSAPLSELVRPWSWSCSARRARDLVPQGLVAVLRPRPPSRRRCCTVVVVVRFVAVLVLLGPFALVAWVSAGPSAALITPLENLRRHSRPRAPRPRICQTRSEPSACVR